MIHKRIVISGGPSSGKTTIINELEQEGHYCYPEISRELIIASKAKGIDQPFLNNPEQFNKELLNARIQQFKVGKELTVNSFYDRGVHDIVGYMYYGEQEIPELFKNACTQCAYDQVFLFPPWEDIHVMDNERYESFDQAKKIYDCLHKAYTEYGYQIIEVPTGTVVQRKEFILQNV